ncbi:sulfurtransferase [Alicyclobacillus cellulosilyticus]|uniref:Sulfurtransferase n=1 Tax=Alicyclobacillus cellulosilyticus TaxID=1003997 RepID=A0A917K274_9BACL|nr:rhodanese-like domain-containing protein [Alicyclobacillus cellulosilyticus]GGI95803.1 sulfurtransferase [Alicyclobacillus cellulosilyticus]
MSWIGLMLLLLLMFAYGVYRMLPVRGVPAIHVEELRQLLRNRPRSVQFVDVREPGEFRQGHIEGFRNIPLSQLRHRLDELDRDKPVVVMCQSGMRSAQAARLLVKHGFSDVRHLPGGILAWNTRRGTGR